MQELTLEQDEYKMLQRCFMGGFTHASIKYVGELVEDVTSIDFTSSYPSVMLAEKYPMSKPIKVDLRKEDFEELVKNDDIGLMFDIKFKNIHSTIFQAVQFMLADMAVNLELSRLITYKAAVDADNGIKR